MQVPPSDTKADEECSPDQLAKERARLTAELADAKKKFMSVAKRKQQEYTKKVNSLPLRQLPHACNSLAWLRHGTGCHYHQSTLSRIRWCKAIACA